jgi:cleavage stimulation factor subunit 2
MPQLPAGVDIPAGISAPDAISATLKQLQPPQLLEILGQMKTLVSQDPMKATELLRQAPQLSYAIFQALLLMNLVDTSVLTQVIEGPAAAPAPPPQAAPQYYATPTPAPQPVVAPPQPAPVQVAPQVQDPQRQQLLQSVMHLTPEQIAAFPPEQQQQIMYLKQTLLAQGGAM